MPRLPRPSLRRPEILGRSRRSRWRRRALRRLVAAGCAVVAVLLLVGVVRPPATPTVEVVVAARDLTPGSVLTAADLSVRQVPTSPGPVGSLGAAADALGRRLTSPMESGEVLTRGRLVPRSPVEGLPEGTVAAHVLVADEGALDLVSAGHRVTLFADVGGPALAQDVLVVGIDTPEIATLAGSLPSANPVRRGLVVALPPTALDRVFAGQRPDGAPPSVLPVVSG